MNKYFAFMNPDGSLEIVSECTARRLSVAMAKQLEPPESNGPINDFHFREFPGYEKTTYDRNLDDLNRGWRLRLRPEYHDYREAFHLFDGRRNINRR